MRNIYIHFPQTHIVPPYLLAFTMKFIKRKKKKPFSFICFPCILSETIITHMDNYYSTAMSPVMMSLTIRYTFLFALPLISLHQNSLWHTDQFFLNSLSLVAVESSVLVFFCFTCSQFVLLTCPPIIF